MDRLNFGFHHSWWNSVYHYSKFDTITQVSIWTVKSPFSQQTAIKRLLTIIEDRVTLYHKQPGELKTRRWVRVCQKENAFRTRWERLLLPSDAESPRRSLTLSSEMLLASRARSHFPRERWPQTNKRTKKSAFFLTTGVSTAELPLTEALVWQPHHRAAVNLFYTRLIVSPRWI